MFPSQPPYQCGALGCEENQNQDFDWVTFTLHVEIQGRRREFGASRISAAQLGLQRLEMQVTHVVSVYSMGQEQ